MLTIVFSLLLCHQITRVQSFQQPCISPSLTFHQHQTTPGTIPRKRNSQYHMFTGIVEEIGEVISLEENDAMEMWDGSVGRGTELVVQGNVVMDGAYLGCSICVSGACLTATNLDATNKQFRVGLAPETLRKTNLSKLKRGDNVNLERASVIGERNSGHFVQGHVDGMGTVLDRWVDGDSLFYKIQFDEESVRRYIVPKGFVCIDGTSLTVCDVHVGPSPSWFTFMLIEYTQKHTIISSKDVGDTVNIEVDVLAKYAEGSVETINSKMIQLEQRILDLENRLESPSTK